MGLNLFYHLSCRVIHRLCYPVCEIKPECKPMKVTFVLGVYIFRFINHHLKNLLIWQTEPFYQLNKCASLFLISPQLSFLSSLQCKQMMSRHRCKLDSLACGVPESLLRATCDSWHAKFIAPSALKSALSLSSILRGDMLIGHQPNIIFQKSHILFGWYE